MKKKLKKKLLNLKLKEKHILKFKEEINQKLQIEEQ